MKPRANALDRQRRQLTYFTACSAGTCACNGFRPVQNNEERAAEGRSNRTEKSNSFAPVCRDLDSLAFEENIIECKTCGHSISNHAEPLKDLTDEEVDEFTDRVADVQTASSELASAEELDDSASLVCYVFQMLMKSLRTLSPVEYPVGKPPFEPHSMSPFLIVRKYIASRPVDNSEKKRLAEIGTLFLTEMNHWKLGDYDSFCKLLTERLEPSRYRNLNVRLEIFVNMPSKFTSFKQYQTVEIFGEKFTILFCDFFMNAINSRNYTPCGLSESDYGENSSELKKFANNLKMWLETENLTAEPSTSSQKRKDSINYSVDDVILKYVKRKKPTDHSESSSPREPSESAEEEPAEVPKKPKKESKCQPSTSAKKSPETEESMAVLRSLIRSIKMDGDLDAMEPRKKVEFEALNLEVSRGLTALQEEAAGTIEFRVIRNDSDPFQSHEQLAQLVELQNLFGVQLPKMPKEYLTRLVFDTRHENMVILKKDVGVIGGICFRTFAARGFVEIVFCAITAQEQVKGYGTHLMNHCKDYMIKIKIYHMLTFADEFAIGYFTKQGYSNKLEINPNVYQGFIKEYEGATLMGCHLHPQISYTKFPEFSKGIQSLHFGYRNENNSEVNGKVFAGLEHLFRENIGNPRLLELRKIPGTDVLKLNKKSSYKLDDRDDRLDSKIASILKKLNADSNSWPFQHPVNRKEVPDYYDFTKHPIDLETMNNKLEKGVYGHQHLFIADLTRMFQNCYNFNAAWSVYYAHGYKLNELALRLLKQSFPDSLLFPELPEQEPE